MSELGLLRTRYHAAILESVLTVSSGGIPSNADKDSRLSRNIASAVVKSLGPAREVVKGAGQTAGKDFETVTAGFLRDALSLVAHLRPGAFDVVKGGGIARFDQYAHLEHLDRIARTNRDVAVALGADYMIKPDIVVSRHPVSDAIVNGAGYVVDDSIARYTPLRLANGAKATLHASISCKWTLRSDRAQNARTEGLNLLRNRKGRLPHIAVITAEPMPSRIASLALGTGDIDCVYHFALPELQAAVAECASEDGIEALAAMVEGRRLRDIADLALDLAV